MPRILIVEDDEAMAVALREGFAFEGYEVGMARDGEEALELAGAGAWDIVLLDVMLPRTSGLDVCRQLRRTNGTLPIIMLTARSQEIDKVVGLKSGADDYVTKPFSFVELMARVEGLLRRSSLGSTGRDVHRLGEIDIDFARMEARKRGAPISLSRLECELLRYLIQHRGRPVPRARLLDAVWGYGDGVHTRTVDVHVAKLRRKLEDRPDAPTLILTVPRVGYKLTG